MNDLKTLVVEDDDSMSRLLESVLRSRGHAVTVCADGASAWDAFQTGSFSMAILDFNLPDMSGADLCRRIRSTGPGKSCVIFFVTARNAPEDLQLVLEAGADDYQTKPVDVKLLNIRLTIAERRARDMIALAHANDRITLLEEQTHARGAFEGLVGRSDAMQEVYRRIRMAADTAATVLILGQSGTGKELVARAIHSMSGRKDKPFLAVNCTAIPEPLLESELFGHVKGAFTGAVRDKPGIFRAADGGTLFLDEIGETPASIQVKLLRVLEQREVPRLGEEKPAKVDVRIVCATNKDPAAILASGALREDFYFRIRVFEIEMPPLRYRPEDVRPLVDHFISEFSGLYRKKVDGVDPAAIRILQSYSWPGNVRELRNTIERAFVTVDGPIIMSRDLPVEIRHARAAAPFVSAQNTAVPDVSADAERRRIHDALSQTGGNQSAAARLLGFSRMTLWKKIRKYNISIHGQDTSSHDQ